MKQKDKVDELHLMNVSLREILKALFSFLLFYADFKRF